MEVPDLILLIIIPPLTFQLRCLLSFQRRGATVNIYSIVQIYRCPRLWCVIIPAAFILIIDTRLD